MTAPAGLFLFAIASGGVASVEGPIDFGRDVRPVLSRNCFVCHGPDEASRERDLRLDRFDDATRERDGFRAIVPGDASDSEAFLRIIDEFDPMPPAKSGHSLSPDEVELIRRWIDEGAEYTPHWAFVAPTKPELPEVGKPGWRSSPIDRLVLARLEREGLAPSPAADRYALARRVSLDVIGLPPSLDDVRAFVADDSSDAYERYVDQLLASPAYGERWASVWLDLARYADSAGHGSDPLRVIWRYRDWVIDALNANMPFDEFTVQQLAGDLLPEPSLNQRLATAFHRNTMTNTEGGTDDEEFRVAAVKDRAITTAQVWLGLTLGCAQCHSHKYDPLSQEEFYSFFAFFNQTADSDKNDDRPRIDTPRPADFAAVEALNKRLAALQAELANPTHDVAAGLAAWEASLRADASWQPVEPAALSSQEGAQLTALDDGSILASGDSPERDVYTIEAQSPLTDVTAVRLEVLPHDSLAAGGPGRMPGNGNVVLNDVQLAAGPADPTSPTARFVRVTNPGEMRILSLAEVEVVSDGQNVASRGTATQSSTAYDGDPARALDGNTDGHYFHGESVTHTRTETDPWWEVDLGQSVPIQAISIWNRTDGGLEPRLARFHVTALDAERQTVWTSGVRRAPRPSVTLDLSTGSGDVLLANASADFSDPEWAIERAIDDDDSPSTGWGLNPSLGGAHVAIFETASPLTGPRLSVRLRQEFGTHHTLGRFRLSVTDAPRPVQVLPRAVTNALKVPADERSDDEVQALTAHYRTIDPELAGVRDRIAALEKKLARYAVTSTPVMVELPPDKHRETHVLVRGNFLELGERVEPGVPAALHSWGDAPPDRLGLARWLVRSDNPLTARVTVNRIWARLFGRGIVETEEDFGTQGTPPTHPELLDWLASALVDSGWDTKAFLKSILMSQTYRQSSVVPAELRERDPRNELYARGPRFRLDAEMVRDVVLATSGLLSKKMYGPSVYPPQPDGMWQAAFNGQRTWAESKGEDRYRRALYVFLRRTVPYPSLATFDATSRESCTPRRSRTNTPLQAFVTLNDPAYVEAAQAFARRIVQEGGATARSRAEYGLWLSLLRPPSEERIAVVLELFASQKAAFAADEDAARSFATDPLKPFRSDVDVVELAAWTAVASVLLNQDGVLTKG